MDSGSWIDIASQPSSSSLSSATDDIVTTGLNVQCVPTERQDRGSVPNRRIQSNPSTRLAHVEESSQDEYDESESESDRILTSSNEGAKTQDYHGANEKGSVQTGGYSTAQGPQCFTPQPNAFSHPPSAPYSNSHYSIDPERPIYTPRHRRQAQSSLSNISTAYQADQDAALRASLNTLLSCAAAARSLNKASAPEAIGRSTIASARVRPSSLRIVPESVVLATRASESPQLHHSTRSRKDDGHTPDRTKRKIAQTSNKDRSVARKARCTNYDDFPAPTLLTWVVSAGVLVLISAISFSAGFSLGMETSRHEAETMWDLNSEEIRECGQQAVRSGLGLRKLRWSSAPSVISV